MPKNTPVRNRLLTFLSCSGLCLALFFVLMGCTTLSPSGLENVAQDNQVGTDEAVVGQVGPNSTPSSRPGEEPAPLCRFDNAGEYEHFVTSDSSAYFVLGDNRIYRSDLDSDAVDAIAQEPDSLTFGPDYRFYDIAIAVSAENLLAVRNREDGALYWVRNGELELIETDVASSSISSFSVSPEGRWVAFSHVPDFPHSQKASLSLIHQETGDATILEDEEKSYSTPVWSPTGEQIAFAKYDDTSSRIQIMDLSTGTVMTISEEGECHSNATWSPDGRFLAFNTSNTSYFSASQLIVVDLVTGERQVVFELNPYPDADNPKDPEDRSLGYIDHISGWSPSESFIMVESTGFNDKTSVCLIRVESDKASCNLKINDWDAPFWSSHSGSDMVGLAEFELVDPRRGHEDLSNRQFRNIELLSILSLVE